MAEALFLRKPSEGPRESIFHGREVASLISRALAGRDLRTCRNLAGERVRHSAARWCAVSHATQRAHCARSFREERRPR